MIQIPRNATLAEALFRDIDKDEYLQEIYGDLLYNSSAPSVDREKYISRMLCVFRPVVKIGSYADRRQRQAVGTGNRNIVAPSISKR